MERFKQFQRKLDMYLFIFLSILAASSVLGADTLAVPGTAALETVETKLITVHAEDANLPGILAILAKESLKPKQGCIGKGG